MKQLNKKEIKELFANNNIEISKKDKIIEDNNIIYINKTAFFIKKDNKILPLLKNPSIENLPNIFVDKNAIPFITKGADIMRPGITNLDDFKENEIIVIRDEKYKKPLAIGITLFDSEEIKKLNKGKVIKTYNFVGDKYW